MGYEVDYEALDAMLSSCFTAVNDWGNGISAVKEARKAIEESTNISGNNADNMKKYLNAAYTMAESSLGLLMERFYQNFLLYTEGYYQQIDGDGNTHIDSAELGERQDDLKGKRSNMQQIATAAESAMQSVSDLVSFSSLDFGDADAKYAHILTSIDNLDESVREYEKTHSSGDFADIDALISQLDAYILDLCQQKKEYKTQFAAGSFHSLASVSALDSAYIAAYTQLTSKESDATLAAENWQERIDLESAEIAKRQEQATWAKAGFNIVISAVSVVATAALMPVIGPASEIVVGAAGGALKAAFSEAADQYAENGWNMQEWEVDQITIHGCIGAVTGMVGNCFPDVGDCTKAGISALSSVFEGVAGTAYDQIADTGRITDVGGIVEDALIKGGSSFVGSMIGSEVSNELSSLVKRNETIKDLAENVVGGTKHFGAVLEVEAMSNLGSGMAKRFSSAAIEETGEVISSVANGDSLEKAFSEHNIVSESVERAFDLSSMVEDAGGAVVTAATDDPLYKSEKKLANRSGAYSVFTDKERVEAKHEMEEHSLFGDAPDLNGKEDTWDDWNSDEYDRMTDKLAEMDARGDDAQNYQQYGDPRTTETQRQAAVKEAWEQERRLVMQGRGTRDWSVSQQEELIRTHKVSGFDGSHMLSVSTNPDLASNPDNIQFLTYEEHIYGAHNGNTRNPTSGRYDPETGETETIKPEEFLPHRNQVAKELSQKFDYMQVDLAEQLGTAFGYGREK